MIRNYVKHGETKKNRLALLANQASLTPPNLGFWTNLVGGFNLFAKI